jgi:hypothetical protein
MNILFVRSADAVIVVRLLIAMPASLPIYSNSHHVLVLAMLASIYTEPLAICNVQLAPTHSLLPTRAKCVYRLV